MTAEIRIARAIRHAPIKIATALMLYHYELSVSPGATLEQDKTRAGLGIQRRLGQVPEILDRLHPRAAIEGLDRRPVTMEHRLCQRHPPK